MRITKKFITQLKSKLRQFPKKSNQTQLFTYPNKLTTMGLLKKSFLILISIAICPLVSAYDIPWRQKSSFQFTKELPISELLRGYFALQGVTAVVDPDIKGSVNGKFADLSPEEFLNRLARSNGLIWFYDGNVVYIDLAQKVESRFIKISSQASKKLLETVSNLGIVSPFSSIRVVGDSGVAFVSGPPRYVTMVSDVAAQLSSILDADYNEKLRVRIFPLKHAYAFDTSYSSQETRVTIPGLANVLRGLMETGADISPEMIVSGQIKTDRIQVADKIKTFNQANGLESFHKQEILPINSTNPVTLPPVPSVVNTPPTLIQPDIRLNAIIVRDVEAKMPQYQAIIDALDVSVFLVEIAVTIVDINTNFTSKLGNEFFSAQKGDSGLSFNTVTDTVLKPAAGFNMQLNALWDGYKIISQIEALATDGFANILARPTILTLNNLEAQISTSSTFYVQLIGVDASDLANVTVGTTLKVTPRVIEDKFGPKRIKLLVDINDGAVTSTSPVATQTGLPQTTNQYINTQAVIYEGQSLFIGGYYRQEKSTNESGIPILKDIPLLGYAFKVKNQTNTTLERMYIITPRVVNIDYERSPDIVDQICDMTCPPQGIAHEMSKANFECEHPVCPKYDFDYDCNIQPHSTDYRRKYMFNQISRYFEY